MVVEEIFYWQIGHSKILQTGYVKIAMENSPVEIVDFPMNSMVIFHSYVNVYQYCKLFKMGIGIVGRLKFCFLITRFESVVETQRKSD